MGEIYGSRVDATGTVLDPSGIAIATGSDGGAFPSIASDGTNALVAFIVPRVDQASLHVARVDASGAVLDPSPVPLPISGLESAVWAVVAIAVALGECADA